MTEVMYMYRSQHHGRRGQRIDTSQRQEVRLCLLDVAHSFFFLAREFDGFAFAFSPCRVQGKPKVACFCTALFVTCTLKFWRCSYLN